MSEERKPTLPKITIAPIRPRAKTVPKNVLSNLVGGLGWPNFPRSRDIQAMAMQVEFAMTERWSPEKLLEYQLAQTQALINHAHKTVPYYKDILTPLAGRKMGSLTMEEFRQLPLLNRQIIQDNQDELVTTDLPESHGKMFDVRTSGSTGSPLTAKGSGVTGMMYIAQTCRGHIWHQRDLSLKSITIHTQPSDEPIKRSKGWAPGSLGMNVRIDKATPTPKMVDILLQEDPDYIQCFPSTLKELLRETKEKNIKFNKLREVRTMSELLEPSLIGQARQQWGIPIIDNYSAIELNIIAHQCPDYPTNKHVMAESLLLEVLDEQGNPCQPGQGGRCVVTTLTNYASPLIRYEIGDYVVPGTPCPCGRGLPTLSSIVGRTFNLMILPNGERFCPTVPYSELLFDLPIKQYQLVQTTLHDVEVRLVTSRKLTEAEEASLLKIYDDEGYPVTFSIHYVDSISNLASGKFELFRCEVDS